MDRKTPNASRKPKARVTKTASKPRENSRRARTERLNARISSDDQILLAKVAGMQGVSVSTFVIQAARARAKALLRRRRLIRLSARDQKALISALLSPTGPNAALMRAAASHTHEVAVRPGAKRDDESAA
jgi:uncharacterized protein (DUF1778 family)